MKDYSDKLVSFSHISPTFFIGLGGSGSDIVNRIAAKLKSRWNWKSMQELVHFFAIDTNTHDLIKQENVPRDNRILISDFDKRTYVNLKRGRAHVDEDPFTTSWIHDWYEFRGTRGAGAGQIRIESRLSLHYQLEQDRGKIVQRLNSAMNVARHHDNPYRKSNPPHFNVFIYGSVAGGTGSGSFLSIAYLLRELIEAQSWIPKIYGTLIMPSLFLNDVPGALHLDINANGYAALKELEHLMKLGAEGSANEETYHYNPERAHQPKVDDKPFDFVYIADKPTTFQVDEYKNAIADAAYLLLYSPLIGAQAGDYDNYEKHQKALISGYTVYYGSNGCSVMILPDKDILEYCAMRFAARAMREYLLFDAGVPAEFAIHFEDPKFRRLSREAQNDEIDRKFCQFIDYMATQEDKDEIENGPYKAVSTLLTPTKSSLDEEFGHVVDGFVSDVISKLSLPTLTATDITENNIKVDSELADLRQNRDDSRARMRPVWDSARQQLISGQTLQDFFLKHRTNPFAQRYFLIKMKDRLRAQIDEIQSTYDAQRKEVDLDSSEVGSKIKDWRERLNETAKLTMMERIKGSNADFHYTRNGFVEYFNGDLVEGNRAVLSNEFRLEYLRAALDHFEKRLESFREVATQAVDAIESLEKEAEESRQSGRFAHGDGLSNAYTLDVEVLEEVGGERLWNFFFEDRFVSEGREFNYFRSDDIFPIITESFNPEIDKSGRRVPRTSREITDKISSELLALGKKRLAADIVGTREGGTDLSQRGLRLDDGLFYEARYHFLRQYQADGSNQEPTRQQLDDYIKSKMRFADSKSGPLANFADMNDTRVINSKVALFGIHDAYRERLGPLVNEVLPQAQAIPHWFDEKAMVFYQANLGIPLYFYKRVNTDLKAAYDRVMSKAGVERGYPLHVDSSWEDSLPNLDPNEAKAAERKDSEREDRLNFGLGFAIGLFRTDSDGSIHWHVQGVSGALGKDRPSAYKALKSLDERTMRRINAELENARVEWLKSSTAPVRELVRGYLAELDEAIWKLNATKTAASADLLKFLELEESLLRAWSEEG